VKPKTQNTVRRSLNQVIILVGLKEETTFRGRFFMLINQIKTLFNSITATKNSLIWVFVITPRGEGEANAAAASGGEAGSTGSPAGENR